MTNPDTVYLDYAASSPVRPEVLEAMLPYLTTQFGNPSSVHSSGRRARAAVDEARDHVAGALGVDHAEITFTSGATEANNLAIAGLAAGLGGDRSVAVAAAEHPSVLMPVRRLQDAGRQVVTLPVSGSGELCRGRPDASALPGLLCAMHVNNETGVVNDVAAIAHWCRDQGVLYHMDGVQSLGRMPVRLRGIGCDSASFSAHKIGGPKGAGVLYVRRGVPLRPLIAGGRQERERRPGTENVAAIVGLGLAAQLADAEWQAATARMAGLYELLVARLRSHAPDLVVVGEGGRRAPGIVCVTGSWGPGADLVMAMDRQGVAVSSGSACSSGAIEPSHVLMAQGLSTEVAGSAIRFSFGASTTADEVEQAAGAFGRCVARAASYLRDR